MDFKGFKKTSDDGKVVTLKHDKGHEIKIVKNAVDRKTREALHAIPNHVPEAGAPALPKRQAEKQQPSQPQKMMAKGGHVENEKLYVADHYADGGDTSQQSDASKTQDQPPQQQASGSPITINVGQPQAPAQQAQQVDYTATDPQEAARATLPSTAEGLKAAGQIAQQALQSKAPSTGPAMDAALAGREPTPEERAQSEAMAAQQQAPPQASPQAPPQNYQPQAQASQPQVAPQIPQLHAPGLRQQQSDVDPRAIMAHVNQTFEAAQQHWQQEHETLLSEIQNDQVDPNRLWNKKSGFDKVASTIGLLLGGITGNKGLLGTYGRLVQNEIDADVAAQQSKLGTDKTLLEAHQKQFGNLVDAANAVRQNLATTVQAKLQQSEGFKSNAEAQKLYQEMDVYRQQLAQQQAIRTAVRAGNGNPQVLGLAVQALVPPAQQAKAFEELDKAQNHTVQTKNILEAFDKVSSENTLAGRAGRLGYEPPSVAAFQNLVMPFLKDAEGRINEQELQRTDKLYPRPGDKESTVAEKRAALANFLNSKAATPILDAAGIFLPRPTTVQRLPTPPGFPKGGR